MRDPRALARLGNAAVVAPAGHGKTEMIAKVAALGTRALVLTHTNAGIQAVRARLKRLKVPHSAAAVDTIAGWSLRYAHAFPGVAKPPSEMPLRDEWDDVYRGVDAALQIPAMRQVLEASYDRILIDEYQDCNEPQHALATRMSGIVPTLIFGDPMQGIFEFAGATLSWGNVIHRQFPLAARLEEPHRWRDKNRELGEWIADARDRLVRGDRVDFSVGPVAYREAQDAFDMGALFESIEGKEGTVAAIHCRKGTCYQIARSARGFYQAIEEMAANTMSEFARRWDRSDDGSARLESLRWLFSECFSQRKLEEGEAPTPEEAALTEAIRAAAVNLERDGPRAALEVLSLARELPRWRLHRQELFRDTERAISEVAYGRCETMGQSAARVRDRASIVGRKLPKRTVSTPLLLKGLEFDHVVVPYTGHFGNEERAQAKLFYVAISRATCSLTLTGRQSFVQLRVPTL
jgi:hypothetical protein